MNIGLSKLPWYGQVGVFVALAGVAAAAFFNFYVSPLQVEMTSQRERLATLRGDINKGLMIARRLPQFEKDVADLQVKLQSLQAVLPEEKDFGDLVRRIQILAQQSNLRVMKITPTPAVTKQLHAEWPFNLELEGNYHNLAMFFDRVSKFQRIINIGNIRIKAKDKPDSTTTIDAQCVATTFVLLPAAKVPAPAPPATPSN
ncbi:MAG: type 4a pilus biogenesis protein PilO [Acidobacteria bacterium]|nr:type 4a pilus biogenesis protein PilO [Acidobacteriota bacterium]